MGDETMAIEEAKTPAASDGQGNWRTEWEQQQRESEQEYAGLGMWLRGRLRRAVSERMRNGEDDGTPVSLRGILEDEAGKLEDAFGERWQGWQDMLYALPVAEAEYSKQAWYRAADERRKAAEAAKEAEAAFAKEVPLPPVSGNSRRNGRRGSR